VENVAHTLAGLLVAEVAVALRRRRGEVTPRFARLAALTSALANNVADADVLYAGITAGKLGYLLHHRGHTHTLVAGLALGLALAGVVVALARNGLTRADRAWLLALGGAGPIVHLAMDGWNVYGVHPFWPIDNRWIYGDAVFIVEPLLWAVAIPPLVLSARSLPQATTERRPPAGMQASTERRHSAGTEASMDRAGTEASLDRAGTEASMERRRPTGTRVWRVFLVCLLVAGLALPWLVPSFVPLGARLTLIAVALLAALASWRTSEPWRAPLGLASFALVAVMFFAAGSEARAQLSARLASAFPERVTHDIALSSLPANPGCWMATAVQTTPSADLVVTRALVAPWPDSVDATSCPQVSESTTAPLEPVPAESDPGVAWQGQFRAPLDDLRRLAAHCEVAALLRFVRAPFFLAGPGGMVVGDLRFDRDPELDFAELEISDAVSATTCPRYVPSWTPPRADLLAP
jgi:inner membrane protein